MSDRQSAIAPSNKRQVRVHMLARKRLLQNARVFKQAASLARSGYDVTLIGRGSAAAQAWERMDGFQLVRVNVGGVLGGLPGFNWLAFYCAAYRLVAHTLPPADIVHCNDLDTLPLGLAIRRVLGANFVVYDVQDLYPEQDNIPPLLSAGLAFAERHLIRRAQRVIVVNDAVGQVLRARYGVEPDATVLNCPPFDGGETWSEKPTVRELLRIPPDQTLIVYSGVLAPRRGLENTLLALRELDSVCLVLLGTGPLRAPLEALANAHRLRDRVHFVEFVHHRAVPAFIHSADLGIVPYERYGLNHYLCSPNKLFHYVMAELPIVCSDFPFLRSIVVDNGVGEVFDPADPQSISCAVLRLRDTPGAINACKERLRSIKRRYCWEEEEEPFLGAYRSLA